MKELASFQSREAKALGDLGSTWLKIRINQENPLGLCPLLCPMVYRFFCLIQVAY
jgi:hypothetical protein